MRFLQCRGLSVKATANRGWRACKRFYKFFLALQGGLRHSASNHHNMGEAIVQISQKYGVVERSKNWEASECANPKSVQKKDKIMLTLTGRFEILPAHTEIQTQAI